MKLRSKGLLSMFINKYGFYGVYCFCLMRLSYTNLLKGYVSIKLPQIKYPFYLRFSTSDFELFRNIFVLGEYDDIRLAFLPQTIIDGGGNIGLAAILFANRYPAAKIVSIEPESNNYQLLLKNTTRYKNLTTIKGGIWHKSTYLNIIKSRHGEWGFTVEETDKPDESSINGLSIPDITEKCGWESAELVKLDIEGSEKEVFEKNADGWVSHTKAIIVETHDHYKPGCSEALLKATEPYGFHKSISGEYTLLQQHISSPEKSVAET